MSPNAIAIINDILHKNGYGVGLILLALTLGSFLTRYVLVQLYTFFADFRLKEQTFLMDAITCDQLSQEMKFHLNDLFEQKIFGKFSGIHNTTPEQRIGLIKLYQLISTKFCWYKIAKSFPYIKFNKNLDYRFKYSISDKIEYYFMNFLGGMVLLLATSVLILAMIELSLNHAGSFFVLMTAGIFVGLSSLWVFSNVYGYKMSREIEKYLSELKRPETIKSQ
jgi:hypothetical protein